MIRHQPKFYRQRVRASFVYSFYSFLQSLITINDRSSLLGKKRWLAVIPDTYMMSVLEKKKRKEPPTTSNASKPERNAKRARLDDARSILTQSSEQALNKHGELDVKNFVKAREVEIKAMEASMGASRKVLSSRAFQQVPNDLRRRTASHNVKKVPKRLRSRAAREVSIPWRVKNQLEGENIMAYMSLQASR